MINEEVLTDSYTYIKLKMKTKWNVKRMIKPTVVGIGIMVFVLALGVLGFLGFETCKFGYQCYKDCWNMWYYVFAIIGSVSTTVAVIVALFKDEILHKFHSPELVLEEYSNGVIPLVKVEGENGNDDSYYKCELKINNTGAENARDCTIVVSRMLYDTSRMGGETEWDSRKINRITEIGEKNNQIISGLDARVELFRINNPSSSSTPSGGNENRAYIEFPQTKLSEEIAAESNFKIEYEIRANNAAPIRFCVSIEWTGKWSDSVSGMKGNIKVKLLMI